MAGDAVASAEQFRPQLKGRHAFWVKKHMAIGIVVSLAAVWATKILVNDKRKAAYAEYYR